MESLEQILAAIDQSRQMPTNFRGSMLWYNEFPVTESEFNQSAVGSNWMLGEFVTRNERLFSDVLMFQESQNVPCAFTAWRDTVSYSTMREADQPLHSLKQLEIVSSVHNEIFTAMQIDLLKPNATPWSKSLGQIDVNFVGEEAFEDLPCLRLEWTRPTELGPSHGYWLVCPQRAYKIVYSETISDAATHGLEGMFTHINHVAEFQLHQGMWIPTKTIQKHGRLFPDGRHEIHPSQRITEIFDLKIGTVEENEPLLTPLLIPGLELIDEYGKCRRIRPISKQRWAALTQRIAVL